MSSLRVPCPIVPSRYSFVKFSILIAISPMLYPIHKVPLHAVKIGSPHDNKKKGDAQAHRPLGPIQGIALKNHIPEQFNGKGNRINPEEP